MQGVFMDRFSKDSTVLTLVDFYSFYCRVVNPKALLKLRSDDIITGGMFNVILGN